MSLAIRASRGSEASYPGSVQVAMAELIEDSETQDYKRAAYADAGLLEELTAAEPRPTIAVSEQLGLKWKQRKRQWMFS